MSTIICPECGDDDSIQRVAAIVTSNTSTASFSGPSGGISYIDGKVGSMGGYSHLSGGSMTNLAKILDLPPEPKIQTITQRIAILYLVAYFIFLCLMFNNSNVWVAGWTVAILAVVATVVMILSLKETNKEISAIKIPNWNLYKLRWEQLYYCHKHGIVFDPISSRTCEPAQMKDFVNELIKDQIIKPEQAGIDK